jgi:hypothetical protein
VSGAAQALLLLAHFALHLQPRPQLWWPSISRRSWRVSLRQQNLEVAGRLYDATPQRGPFGRLPFRWIQYKLPSDDYGPGEPRKHSWSVNSLFPPKAELRNEAVELQVLIGGSFAVMAALGLRWKSNPLDGRRSSKKPACKPAGIGCRVYPASVDALFDHWKHEVIEPCDRMYKH